MQIGRLSLADLNDPENPNRPKYKRRLEWYCEDRGLWLEGGPSIDAVRNQREIAQCAFAALGPKPYEDFCITCEHRMGYVEGAYCTVVWDRETEQWVPEWEHVYCHQANWEQKQELTE